MSFARPAKILSGVLLTVIAVGLLTDFSRGLNVGILSILVWTFLTIPGDLKSGEYDLLGLGILALFLIAGLVVWAMNDEPRVPYYKGDDPPEAHPWER